MVPFLRASAAGGNPIPRFDTKEAGVAAVPVSAFYVADAPTNFVRFCFCKKDEVIDGALERLDGWVRKQTGAGASAPLGVASVGGD